ncbi:glutaredoxin family protein [Geobacillus stearothermophilus]|uniref:glutaredoxin family protein n=1 Tax=Geobacillus TaxID=129337 RepID=UPI0005CD2FE7|nr:glutaredoxin family protein [Geobacillus stearothermophilus]AKM19256.1 Glutaredoxin-3 [Geobacillus sp. 12AMOR1]MED0655408.1 glutaredoxin family protein [Anoxybacillus geothermalis]STO12424.1 Glutaredoxin-3 [[Flavobacterium] thermophilum]MED4270341.1 glutaredoxin family protein [Geobacillus stearothermophilus]MED4299152.1 glutaredoxin family protein [Geobacillus stearothermophilus]
MAQVTVYTTTTCPYCVMAKNFLRAQGIPFKEVNVELDPEAARRLVETTGQMGVPQIEIGGRWVLGYDPDAIMALWNQTNHR